MKGSRITCVLTGLLAMAASAGAQQPKDPNSRAFMGVWLDPKPLPGVVTKNLGLAPHQGLRIENVHRDGPADKAGLERDDIIFSHQGKDVNDMGALVDAVSKMGVGKRISLEVIHLGQRKTVTLTLAPSFQGGFAPKYPPEPSTHDIWRGRFLRFDQKSGQWVETPFPGPADVNGVLPPPWAKEVHTFNYVQDNEKVTVIIEGNPYADDSTVIVKVGQAEYKSPVGKANELLPQAYRDHANQAIKAARQDSRGPNRNDPPWRGRGPRPQDGKDFRQYPDGQQRDDYTRRMLDRAREYIEGMDQDQLSVLKEKVNQLQAQIDQVQRRAAKEAASDPNRPADPNRPRERRGPGQRPPTPEDHQT